VTAKARVARGHGNRFVACVLATEAGWSDGDGQPTHTETKLHRNIKVKLAVIATNDY